MSRPRSHKLSALVACLVLGGTAGCKSTTTADDGGAGGRDSGGGDGGGLPQSEGASVLRHHKHLSRDGFYIEPTLTRAAAAKLHRDKTFGSTMIAGPVYAQPLYMENGPGGKDALFVATETNVVYALDAQSGALIWQRALGTSVPLAKLTCGNIDPLGVTGAPVIDLATRTLFVDAMTTPDDGTTKRHKIFALSVDDGAIRPGWPVDVEAKVAGFVSAYQNQRGALLVLGDTVYVPYGGHYGDCGFDKYHGWVVGVPTRNPAGVKAWSTRHSGGGAWAPGGLSSDGTSIYVTTGNSNSPDDEPWGDGEAVIRLGAGPTYSQQPVDYFTPTDWRAQSQADLDIGGAGPVLFDVPGATPSRLIVSLGKNGKIYLLDRANLGGVGEGVASLVARVAIVTAAAAYTVSGGSYVVFFGYGSECPDGQEGDLVALKIGATAPPTIKTAWCNAQYGAGSPVVTTTDGRSESIVWGLGAEADSRLHAFNAETGEILFLGGGADETVDGLVRYQAPIVVKGRIFVAGAHEVYAFTTR